MHNIRPQCPGAMARKICLHSSLCVSGFRGGVGAIGYLLLFLFMLSSGYQSLAIATPEKPELTPLANWRFDPQQQTLLLQAPVTTIPQYFLLDEPTRIVIDLPGTRWPNATVNQAYSGTIKQLRIGQFDESTTRIVLTWAGNQPPPWLPNFHQLPQDNGPRQWIFAFPAAIASAPPPVNPAPQSQGFVFPPALLPPTQAIPIELPLDPF